MRQMKRALSFVLALTMLVSMFSVAIFSTSAEATTYVLGDADMSGKVNVFDATEIQLHCAEYDGHIIEEGTVQYAAADADISGKVNIFDVTAIQMYCAEYDDIYGIGQEKTFGEDSTDVTEPTQDDSVEGYYLVGSLGGESLWNDAPLTLDRKLRDTDGDGIYTLDWTFYMGDELKVVEYDGTTITRWFKDGSEMTEDDKQPDGTYNNNYKIGTESKTGLCTLSFDPTGSQGYSYIYFTVKQKEVVETEPTEEQPTQGEATDDQPTVPETEPETEAPTTAPVGGPGYYMVGKFDGTEMWYVDSKSADRKLAGPDENGDYSLDWTFYMGDQVKVAYYDGTSITKWFKDGLDNHYSIGKEEKTGLCTLSFNPEGKDTSIWSYTYFTVQKKAVVETEAPTAEPTAQETEAETVEATQGEATDDDPTVAETEEATVVETEAQTEAPKADEGYYLVGTLNTANCWFVDDTAADRKLVYDEATGNYTIDWTFVVGDEIKVVKYDGTSITRWFKDANDSWTEEDQEKGNNNYRIGESKAGLGTLTFNPEGGIGSYGYFTVQPKPVVETEAPTAVPTVAETEAETEEPTEEETVAETEAEEPTQAEATPDDPTVAETEEATVVETEAQTEAPKAEAGYYLVGTLEGENYWFVDATATDRMLAANPGNEGEYMLKWTFDAKDAIKVVYFDGDAIKTWYNDGGDNYTVGEKKAGPCTLYFRPEGNGDWSYFYFTVIADTVEPTVAETEAETEAPTAEPTEEPTVAETEAETEEPTQAEATPDDPTVAETEEPTVEETEAPTEEPTDPPVVIPAGYYLVGTLNGEDCWTVDENSADRMFEANAENEGEYMLDWTFVEGDEIKVVYFNGTEIEKWFKDGSEVTEDDKQDDGTYNNNYKISAAKAGEKTMYFRPEGNADWSYKYFTVPSTVAPVDYYLVGYINGADYGIEGDSANIGEYKFVDGKLVATFSATSYVFVKTSDNANWYMTDGWAGEVSSATLYNTNNIGTDANKLYVPGNVEVTFTLVDNGDDTFTLSYTVPQAPTEETLPSGGGSDLPDDPVDLPAGYYLIGDMSALSSWRTPSKLTADRQMTDEDGDGIYEVRWNFVGGETVAAVYYDGTSITAEYPNDGKGDYKIGVGSNKTGDVIVSCSPEGKLSSSRKTFSVNRVS